MNELTEYLESIKDKWISLQLHPGLGEPTISLTPINRVKVQCHTAEEPFKWFNNISESEYDSLVEIYHHKPQIENI